MSDYCLIIKNASKKEEVFKPIKKAKLGKTVWYKNGNGNWYRGIVVKELEKVVMPLVPPPNNERMAVTVDCGDLVLLLNEDQLFELQT